MRWHAAAALVLAMLLTLGACKPGAPSAPGGGEVLVAAAASLRGVMPQIVEAYGKEHGASERFTVTFGASGDLRQQVVGGAPVDVVVFASGKPVDELIQAKLVDAAT